MPPGRPIISYVKSVSRRSSLHLLDSLHVISLCDFSCHNNSILFTMYVASLYTNLPIDESLEAVSRAFLCHLDPMLPDASILSILAVLLRNNDFIWCDEGVSPDSRRRDGLSIRPRGASFSNIFLSEWEEKVLAWDKKPAF